MKTKPIDLIYHSLKNAIINSYHSGDMDNKMGQLEKSLKYLDELYDPTLFHNGNINATRVRLLTEVQAKVDESMGRKNFSDIWE